MIAMDTEYRVRLRSLVSRDLADARPRDDAPAVPPSSPPRALCALGLPGTRDPPRATSHPTLLRHTPHGSTKPLLSLARIPQPHLVCEADGACERTHHACTIDGLLPTWRGAGKRLRSPINAYTLVRCSSLSALLLHPITTLPLAHPPLLGASSTGAQVAPPRAIRRSCCTPREAPHVHVPLVSPRPSSLPLQCLATDC